ncbi:MAG: hypothetical protein U1E25_14435 [Methylocystis sp.]
MFSTKNCVRAVLLAVAVILIFSASTGIGWAQSRQHTESPPGANLRIQQIAQAKPEPGQPPAALDTALINSMSSVVKMVLDTNNETVKRVEAFYSNTIQNFVFHITIVAALVGLIGVAALGVTASAIAKKQSNLILNPYKTQIENFSVQSTKLISDYNDLRAEYDKLKDETDNARITYRALADEFSKFQESAISNLHGLRSAVLASYTITFYMQNPIKLKSKKEEARKYILSILNDIKPNDGHVLSLTHSVYGIILFLDGSFKEASEAFAEAVAKNHENISAVLNGACCACKLAEECEKANDDAGVIRLEAEALGALKGVLDSEPWRKDEIRAEAETGDLQRLKKNPAFQELMQ